MRDDGRGRYLLAGGVLLSGWWALYLSLPPFSMWFTYSLLSLAPDTRLGKVLKVRLVATFAGVVGVGILLVGYLFNLIV